MINYWLNSADVRSNIFIPKYYDPSISARLSALKDSYKLLRIGDLIDDNTLRVDTGDEIGKMAYGTGDIPFIRTSDIANWEIKSMPKQGVSEEIYELYREKQDVQEGDILLVRDGTYLIGTNCFITELDSKILYQSHILKFRINDKSKLDPRVFFIALNSIIVQQQFRAIQFTADIIDTIGNRYTDIIIPYPNDQLEVDKISRRVTDTLNTRVIGKAFIRECPRLIESALENNNTKELEHYYTKSITELKEGLNQDTITAEFGTFQAFWQKNSSIENQILIPKYYDPSIVGELKLLSKHCEVITMGQLKRDGVLDYYTGDEIGKMAYGTGNIPFIRTSDFSNWEISHNPKQGISREIFEQYLEKEDVRTGDILIVRDGTYLVGTSCMITEHNETSLFCGGLYKIRILDESVLSRWLLLGLLNCYIVKRQIRTKQFTRDVIDTIGNRIDEIFLPIPKDEGINRAIEAAIKRIVDSRITARNEITTLAKAYAVRSTSD